MATAQSVKAKIQGLIASANTKTGNTDENLTAAVNALMAGFGQESGGGSVALLHRAEVTEPVSMISIDIPNEWKNYTALLD